jgi:hypothetical protein
MGKSLAHYVKGWVCCGYLLVHENKILSTMNFHKLPTFGAQLCMFYSLVLMRATFAKKNPASLYQSLNKTWGTLVQNNKQA